MRSLKRILKCSNSRWFCEPEEGPLIEVVLTVPALLWIWLPTELDVPLLWLELTPTWLPLDSLVLEPVWLPLLWPVLLPVWLPLLWLELVPVWLLVPRSAVLPVL